MFLAGNSPKVRSYTARIYTVLANHPIYVVFTIFLAGKSPEIRSYTAHIYIQVANYHIYPLYIRCFWQEIHQKYGRIRRIYIRFWPTTIYICCTYDIFGRKITKSTVIYGAYIYGSGQPFSCAALRLLTANRCSSMPARDVMIVAPSSTGCVRLGNAMMRVLCVSRLLPNAYMHECRQSRSKTRQ